MPKRTPASTKSSQSIRFIDHSVELDEELRLVARLCTSFSDIEPLEAASVIELGTLIERYLDRRLVLEHALIGRSLAKRPVCLSLLASELSKYRRN